MSPTPQPVKVEAGQAFQSWLPGKYGAFVIIDVSPRLGAVHAYKITTEAAPDATAAASLKSVETGDANSEVHRTTPSAACPENFTVAEIEVNNGTAITAVPMQKSRAASFRSREGLDKEQKLNFDRIKGRIEKTWAQIKEEWALDLGNYSKVVSAQAAVHGVHRTTLGRDMGRFFQSGLDADAAAMTSIFGRAVRQQKEAAEGRKRNVKKKLGRKRDVVKTGHDSEATGTNVTDAAKDALKKFLAGMKDRQGHSYASLRRAYRRDFAVKVVGVMDDGFVVKAGDSNLDMTGGQFTYHVKQIEDAVTRAVKKVGRKTFDLRKRILTGDARAGIGFPGHTYVIDSTVLDIYCVSAIDRRLLIGRPVLYLVVDAFSQAILAVHVALEGPNMVQARTALYLAVSNKEEHLSNLGVRGNRSGCVQGVSPLFVFSDRGELLSADGRELSEVANLAQSIAAAYRADWKSLVERPFGTLNTEVIHWVPGGVRERVRQRGDRERKYDAVLCINELKRLLWSYVLEWNLTKDMSNHTSCQMLRHEIDASPVAFWHYGLEHLNGSPMCLTEEQAILKYLAAISTKTKRNGVHPLQKVRFTANWMRRDVGYYELVEGSGEALVYLDPNRPLGAYLLDPTAQSLRKLNLVDRRDYGSQDVCLEDILMMEDYMPLTHSDGEGKRQGIKDSQDGERSTIIEEASKKTATAKANDARSRTQRGAEIRINRGNEVAAGFGLPGGNGPLPEPEAAAANDEMDALYHDFLAGEALG
jgi:putative transposase